jgi:hypothetical protein
VVRSLARGQDFLYAILRTVRIYYFLDNFACFEEKRSANTKGNERERRGKGKEGGQGKKGSGKEGVKSKHLTLAIGPAMRKQCETILAKMIQYKRRKPRNVSYE